MNNIFLPFWQRPKLQMTLYFLLMLSPQAIVLLLGASILSFPVLLSLQLTLTFAISVFCIFNFNKAFLHIRSIHSQYGMNLKSGQTHKMQTLMEVVEKCAQKSNLSVPKIHLVKDDKTRFCIVWVGWWEAQILIGADYFDAYCKNEFTDSEMASILSHEMGHYIHQQNFLTLLGDIIEKLNKFYSVMAVASVMLLLSVALLGLIVPSVMTISLPTLLKSCALTSIFIGYARISSYIGGKGISRAKEFQADIFSLRLAEDKNDLGWALKKISTIDNFYKYYTSSGSFFGIKLKNIINDLKNLPGSSRAERAKRRNINKSINELTSDLLKELSSNIEVSSPGVYLYQKRLQTIACLENFYDKPQLDEYIISLDKLYSPAPVCHCYSLKSLKKFTKSFSHTHPSNQEREALASSMYHH